MSYFLPTMLAAQIDCFGSSAFAWAERVLKHGYSPTLAERHAHSTCGFTDFRSRPLVPVPTLISPLHHHISTSSNEEDDSEGKSSESNAQHLPFTHTDITSDPSWELIGTGCLFYKLFLMKGYLPDRSIISHKSISNKETKLGF